MLWLLAGWSSAAHMNNMWLFKLHKAAADPPLTLPTLRDQTRTAANVYYRFICWVPSGNCEKCPSQSPKWCLQMSYSVYGDIKQRNSSQQRNQRTFLKKTMIHYQIDFLLIDWLINRCSSRSDWITTWTYLISNPHYSLRGSCFKQHSRTSVTNICKTETLFGHA